MKWILLALVIVSAAAQEPGERMCNSPDECEEDECCVSNIFRHILNRGVCQKLREEGQFCIQFKKNEVKKDFYAVTCPCKDGLKCESQYEIVVFNVTIQLSPECVVPGQTKS